VKGTYVLIIHVPYDLPINIGELGKIEFREGYYAYVGSALGGLESRVGRHQRKDKKLHWHIDYLLTRARVIDFVYAPGGEKLECEIAKELAKNLPSIHGFGSSDCKCESHLFYSPDVQELLKQVAQTFKACGLRPSRGPFP
jgi:Uri superfamily endonuclease